MIETIKKTLLAGVGAAVITKEKLEASLGDLIKQGKITAEEAKELAEKISRDGRAEFETMSRQLGDRVGELLSRDAEQTKAQLAALEARVRALEEKTPARSRKS